VIGIAAVIAAATAAGFGAEHRMGERAEALARRTMRLILWVLLPLVVFFNVATLDLTAEVGAGIGFAYAALVTVLAAAYLIGTHLLRLPRPAVGALMVSAGLANTGYLGLPFSAALFGLDELPNAIAYDIALSSAALVTIGFSIGAAFGTVAEGPRDRAAAFFTRNPALWAAAAAVVAPAVLTPDWAVDASGRGVRHPAAGLLRGGRDAGRRGRAGRAALPPATHPAGGNGRRAAADAGSGGHDRAVEPRARGARVLRLAGGDGQRYQRARGGARVRARPQPGGGRDRLVDRDRGGRRAGRGPAVASRRMPPAERPLPRYAAEPPQEPLPYGRWGEALGEQFLAAAATIETDQSLGDPGDISWFPDRTWGGRTYVPATAPTSEGYELFGYVSYTREHEGAQATAFAAVVDYTDETAEAHPEWTLDLSDQEIGHWRGTEGRRGVITLVWGVSLVDNGGVATTELGPTTTDQCVLVDDRFTLLSLDDYTGDYVEVRLYAGRGAELAKESLYEED